MSQGEGADLDPEVLADPLDPEPNPESATAEPAESRSGSSQHLAPVSSRSLVPSDPFRRYMAEIRAYPKLTREEEQDLARRYRDTGDRPDP